VFASVIPSDTTAPRLRLKISYGLLWMWTLGSLGRARSYGRLDYVKRVIAVRFRNMVQSIGIEPELLRPGHGFERIALARVNESGTEPNPSQRKFRMAEHYLEVVLDCFSRREDWQLIAACRPLHPGLRARVHARNMHLFQRLPQLALLARADLVITGGGAGTVRRCIISGVSMLVYPARTDRFGNAARVLSRNVWIRGDILAMTAEAMTKSVEGVLADAAICKSVAEIRAR
jgi:hypothetical protein